MLIQTMSFFYSVYGLRLCANQAIPGLVPIPPAQGIDVQVWLNVRPAWLSDLLKESQPIWGTGRSRDKRGEPTLKVWKPEGGEYFRLLYQDGTEFVVDRKGTQVWADWSAAATIDDTATYLLGPILGFALRLRGVTCLHASAVVVGDRAIALLGPPGAGKSTTAAAFARLGYPILSDDVVALADQCRTFLVQPAYPRLRLWPSSVQFLYGSSDALPRITPADGSSAWWDKRHLDLSENGYRFQQEPVPLAAIYSLSERHPDRAAACVEEVLAPDGLITLVANTYTNYLLDMAMRAEEFELLGRIMAGVPLRRVCPTTDPASLPQLCELILDDVQALSHVPAP